MKNYFFLILLSGSILLASGQTTNIRFDRLGTENGLSQSHVKCILQDSRGFMWFGTRDGLNKYDGYRFTIYKPDTSKNTISNGYIWDIVEDKKGNIWIATMGGGLNKYDYKANRFTHFKNQPGNLNTISSNLVSSLATDRNGNIWIGTEDAGACTYNESTGKFTRYTPGGEFTRSKRRVGS